MKHEDEKKEKAWHLREQRWGSFERYIALPTHVVADRANADFENGVLTITLPKADVGNVRFFISLIAFFLEVGLRARL